MKLVVHSWVWIIRPLRWPFRNVTYPLRRDNLQRPFFVVSTHRQIFVKLKFTSPNFRVENSQNLSNHHLQTIQGSLKLPTQTQHLRGNPSNLYHMFAASLIQLLPKWISFNDKCAIPHSVRLPPRCYFHRPRVVMRLSSPNVVVLRHQPCCKPKAMSAFLVESKQMRWSMLFWKRVGFFWGKSCLMIELFWLFCMCFRWLEVMNKFFWCHHPPIMTKSWLFSI